MKSNMSLLFIVLWLALPCLLFFCTSTIFLNAVLLVLSSACFLIIALEIASKKSIQSKYCFLIILFLIIILVIFLIKIIPIQTVVNSVAILAFSSVFIILGFKLPNTVTLKSIFFITFLESFLFLFTKISSSSLFYPNNSILSILLSCQFAFLLPTVKNLIQKHYSNKNNLINILIVFLFCLILVFTGGRAGLISFTAILIIMYSKFFKINLRAYKFFSLIILLICFSFLFIKKVDSSNGRILIYKVVFNNITPSQLITGVGYGKFKVKYNHYQSNYFSTNPINSSEALLAGNTYFAFNDPFQLLVEIGIIGLIIFIFLILLLVKRFITDTRSNDLFNNPNLLGAYLCIFSFLFSSLFSYPFQVILILPIFLLAVAIIYNAGLPKTIIFSFNSKFTFKTITFLSFFAATFLTLFFSLKYFSIYFKVKEAEKLALGGFKKRAATIYAQMYNDIIVAPNIYYPFAVELNKLNEIDSALIVLNKSTTYIYNDFSAILLADLYYKKGQLNYADSFYSDAVFINPKSFRNRYALFTFYLETKQYTKALFWGNSIIELKPKIPSDVVTGIKNKTTKLLENIK